MKNINLLPLLNEKTLRDLRFILKKFEQAGYEVYLVGGCVRDMLLGRKVHDLDFTTNAHPRKVMKMFGRLAHPVGIEYGTVLLALHGGTYEVTTYRHDVEYIDGRRPSKVHFSETLEEDVRRRDFTINGIAYDARKQQLVDFVGGYEDLQDRNLRTIGNPLERLREDGLRSVRACRFSAVLGFPLQDSLIQAIRETLDVTAMVARERFYDEWRKVSKSLKTFAFLENLETTGLLRIFLPYYVEKLQDSHYRSNLKKHFSRFRMRGAIHAILVLEMYGRTLPAPRQEARNLQARLSELKFSNKEKKLAESILISSIWFLKTTADDAEIKEALSLIPRQDTFVHLRAFHEHSQVLGIDGADQLLRKMVSFIRHKEPLYIKDLDINGDDLKEMGIQGKQIGVTLKKLLKKVHKEPALNQKSMLANLARQEIRR